MDPRAGQPAQASDLIDVDAILQQLQHYARLGISAAQGIVPGVWKLSPLKILGKEVVPTIADW